MIDVMVHSKLMIVDDVLLHVGSANLNNRSIGLDTECDLAIEARTQGSARRSSACATACSATIAALRRMRLRPRSRNGLARADSAYAASRGALSCAGD